MRRILCILVLCALLAGCGAESSHILNDIDKDDPLRIVAVVQTSVPATAAPVASLPPEGTPDGGLWAGLWPFLPTDTPAPTDAPAFTNAPAFTDAPVFTDTPAETPAPLETDEPEGMPLPTATPDVPRGVQLTMVAQQYLNYPYTRGGDSPEEGFDPSGFVYWCLKEMGVSVPRRTSAGYAEEEGWTKITRFSDLEAGDLLFFKTGDNENINCVCIYLGDNRMIYPSTSKQTVILSEINSYWTNAFQWARRVF